MVAGIILLDENNTTQLGFGRLDNESARKLGISESDQTLFNLKVSSVNQIVKSITKKCASIASMTSTFDHSTLSECAEKRWEDYKLSNPTILTKEVFGVIQTLRSQGLNQ